MGSRQWLSVGARVLGLYGLVMALQYLGMFLYAFAQGGDERFLHKEMWGALFAIYALVGILLLVFGGLIGKAMAREIEETRPEGLPPALRREDVLEIAFTVSGAVILLLAIPDVGYLVSTLASEDRMVVFPPGRAWTQGIAIGLKILLAAWMCFGARSVRRLVGIFDRAVAS